MPEQLNEGYKKVASDPNALKVMHDRDAKRIVNFTDTPGQVTTITPDDKDKHGVLCWKYIEIIDQFHFLTWVNVLRK